MVKPKAVVFDLGNVLLDFDYRIVSRKMREFCPITEEELLKALNQSPLLHKYESGGLSSEQFFEEMKQACSFRGEFREFEAIFADIFRPVPEMIDLQKALEESGIPTFLFSNTNDIAIRHIRTAYPFVRNFTGEILSYEHGAIKPQPAIYGVVEKLSGFEGADLLYIDDRLENIEAGRERGWQTIHHHEPADTIRRVETLVGWTK
jgi:HAD superfamily hydrolase (TIGR01509 family)